MVKFVEIPTGGPGETTPVNPEQVRYVRRSPSGLGVVVFGAFEGGADMLTTSVSQQEACALLEGSGVMSQHDRREDHAQAEPLKPVEPKPFPAPGYDEAPNPEAGSEVGTAPLGAQHGGPQDGQAGATLSAQEIVARQNASAADLAAGGAGETDGEGEHVGEGTPAGAAARDDGEHAGAAAHDDGEDVAAAHRPKPHDQKGAGAPAKGDDDDDAPGGRRGRSR